MNAHGPHGGSKPTGSLPSPSSSSEMYQCLSAREDDRVQDQGQLSMPLRGPRPSFCPPYIADSMWADEADISGLNMPQAQRSHLTLDMWNDMFGAQDHQQPAWLPSLTDEDDTSSAARAGSQSYITNQIPSVAYGEPRPSTPASHQNEDEDEDQDLSTESVEDEAHSPGDALKTAAERRAEKRKSKRFRLTHNQTRFLMSEFTRQAHPNAAQRERLSREIPGLSPRQVQVWFQNRRAKLKRFTTDDQESMLKSRALPAGFNTTQTLNYAHDAPRHRDLGGPSSFFHSSQPEYELRRSLILGNLGCAQAHDDNISPTSVPSNFVDASFPGSEILSNSPLSDRSHFYTPPASQGTSPRLSSSSTRSSSFPAPDQTSWRRGGSPLQQRLVRSRAGSSAFPVSYATKLAEHNRHHAILLTQANQPHHDSQHPFNASSGNISGSVPTQLYTTHKVKEFFDTVWANPNMDGVWPPSSSVNTIGHRMYGSRGGPLQTQHNLPTRQVQSAPLSAPPEFYLPDWTAQYPPSEACFPTAFDYGQGSSADQVWSPSPVFPPYPAQIPQHSLLQGHPVMSSNSGAGNAAPRPEHIEPWPE